MSVSVHHYFTWHSVDYDPKLPGDIMSDSERAEIACGYDAKASHAHSKLADSVMENAGRAGYSAAISGGLVGFLTYANGCTGRLPRGRGNQMIAELYDKMSRARAESGRSLRRQLLDMAKLYRGRGRLGPSEYFDYRLYDGDRAAALSRHEFAGYKISSKIDKHWNAYTSWIVTGDKLLFYAALHGFGLPHPEIYAVTHPLGRQAGLAPCFADQESLSGFLRDGMTYPFFSKPIFGSFGRGAYNATGVDRDTDELVLAKGERMPIADFCREMLEPTKRRNKSLSGNIIQQALTPHSDIERVCGPNISGVRVVLLLRDARPEMLAAVWKITTGDNYVDNFSEGKFGNMLGNVDIASGKITRVQRGIGLDMEENVRHPDTGERLKGFNLPDWEAVRKICLAAATIAPELRFQHWDIALTGDGPVLLELNVQGSLDLVQLASQRGIFEFLEG